MPKGVATFGKSKIGYLRRHILRYLDLRVSGDVIPKSAYLDARRKALWTKKLSSWSFLPSTSCPMRAYSGSSVFLVVLRVVRYKIHECLKSLRHAIAENIAYSLRYIKLFFSYSTKTHSLNAISFYKDIRYWWIILFYKKKNNISRKVMRNFYSNKKIKI